MARPAVGGVARELAGNVGVTKIVMVERITAANAGRRFQFHFAVHVLQPCVAEFRCGTRTQRSTKGEVGP